MVERTQTPDPAAQVEAQPIPPGVEVLPGQAFGAGFLYAAPTTALLSLPRYTDDIDRDFGLDTYLRMMNDPLLAASIRALKIQCLSSEPRLLNPIAKPSRWNKDAQLAADYARGQQIADAATAMLEELQDPLSVILADMLDCLAYGHSLAEQVYTLDGGTLALSILRPKSRERYAYVVDRYLSLVGAVPMEQASGLVLPETIIPRRKLWHLVTEKRQSDPRGRSLLRSAYNAWYLKQEAWQDYLKFLRQYATPSIAALLEDNAPTVLKTDARGLPMKDANGQTLQISMEQAVTEQLTRFANSTAMAAKYVKELKLLQSTSNGGAYLSAIDLYNREMAHAVVIVIRVLLESQFGSRADSDTSKDLHDTFVSYLQRTIETSFKRQVVKPWVELAYGPEDAKRFCPQLVLSADTQRGTLDLMNGVSRLANAGYLDESQYPELDAMMGLPERDMEAMEARKAAAMASLPGAHPPAGDDGDGADAEDAADAEDDATVTP